MSNDVATPKSFDERMLELFRTNVGTLLTDEEMKKIVETGMQKLFFEERRIRGQYSNQDKIEPPLAFKLAEDLFQKTMEETFLKWMNENKEQIIAMIEKQLSNENLHSIMLQMFSQMFTAPILTAQADLKNKVMHFAFQNNLNTDRLHE